MLRKYFLLSGKMIFAFTTFCDCAVNLKIVKAEKHKLVQLKKDIGGSNNVKDHNTNYCIELVRKK